MQVLQPMIPSNTLKNKNKINIFFYLKKSTNQHFLVFHSLPFSVPYVPWGPFVPALSVRGVPDALRPAHQHSSYQIYSEYSCSQFNIFCLSQVQMYKT